MIPHLPKQQISIRNNYTRLTRDVLQTSNLYVVGLKAEKYIQSKYNLSDEQMNRLLWKDFE